MRCPYCGAIRQSNLSNCSKCGREIKVLYEPKTVPTRGGWFVACPKCGALREHNRSKCSRCGEIINVATTVTYEKRLI